MLVLEAALSALRSKWVLASSPACRIINQSRPVLEARLGARDMGIISSILARRISVEMRASLLSHDSEGRRPDSPAVMLEVNGKRPTDKARDLRVYDFAASVKARGKRVHYRAPRAPAAHWHKTHVFKFKLALRLEVDRRPTALGGRPRRAARAIGRPGWPKSQRASPTHGGPPGSRLRAETRNMSSPC